MERKEQTGNTVMILHKYRTERKTWTHWLISWAR